MPRRILAFAALAAALALLFVRLGFWQLDRLAERRAYNARLTARLAISEVPFQELGAEVLNRRVVVEGSPDYAAEFVHTGRSRNGSPGVHVITPVRLASSDTVVLVNRGWVYAADAATVDLSRFREPRTRFSGYTVARPAPRAEPLAPPKQRAVRNLDSVSVARLLAGPVAPVIVIARDSGGAEAPVRLPDVVADDGPHLSYAIQWFAFALIALGGAVVVAYRARGTRRAGSTGA